MCASQRNGCQDSHEMSRKKIVGRSDPWEKVILGSPQSKANSRRIALVNNKVRSIKSKAALAYVRAFQYQCPTLTPMFEDDVAVTLHIFYASRRNDLDESIILDALQGKVYANDRQVKRKLVQWGLDPENPRTHIRVERLSTVQGD